MTTVPTPHAPVPALLTSLERAGWGELTGREWQGVRTTLRALAAVLPHKSGQGWSTAPQIAMSAGLSERWVRRCLLVLEQLGVVEWKRGGAANGEPLPSHFRIVKAVLVELIRAARPVKAAAEAARRTATRARIAAASRVARPGRYRRSGPPPELSASPPTPKGGGATARPSPENGDDMRVYVNATCEHGGDAGFLQSGQPRCPQCRHGAAQRAAAAARKTQTIAPRIDHQALAANDDVLLDLDA